MTSKKKMIGLVAATLVALTAAGGLMVWAAPPDGKDGVEQTAPESAGSNSGGVTASMPMSTPRAVPRNSMDAELIGTAVVEGGTSYAVFQSASGTRLVREGDDIVSGVRLVQIWKNRIDVERNGVHEEIRLGSSEGTRQQVHSSSKRVASGVEVRRRLLEDLRARGRL